MSGSLISLTWTASQSFTGYLIRYTTQPVSFNVGTTLNFGKLGGWTQVYSTAAAYPAGATVTTPPLSLLPLTTVGAKVTIFIQFYQGTMTPSSSAPLRAGPNQFNTDATFNLQTGNSPRVTLFRGKDVTYNNNVATVGSVWYDGWLTYRLGYNCQG